MHLKKYTIAAFILIVVVGWYVYAFITQDSLSIELFGVTLPSLSIAVLVVLPMILLYIASLLHMLFYSLVGMLKVRKYKKDHEEMVDSIVDAYLAKENRSHSFKTPKYKLLGTLVDNATVSPTAQFNAEVENKKINDVLTIINNIKNGEIVDLRKYSLLPSNPFAIQNDRNRYKKGVLSAEDILSSKNKYDISLQKEVYIDFVKKASLNGIEKYKNALTKEAIFEILSRINADSNTLVISNESLISLCKDLSLSSKEYVEASKKLSKSMLPEQRMKLFETLSNDNDLAMEAYLFTLFDLEMLTPAKDILDVSQAGDYPQFKAYSSLKECGKHFDINLFI
ncbi:MAG: hypothetical protein PHI38_03955 [Sulfurimonas sp.]|jgi:hypothetical protein|uniref:hypothetical protein n=1 Tax=Sulfurimonas sp. TaxID=2022749 RepID=UPI0026318805|nr:hypothetical protein [Sulfurimonas sp.]MDD3476001.1 hypothetical protein [Sulfurimonas sp.]